MVRAVFYLFLVIILITVVVRSSARSANLSPGFSRRGRPGSLPPTSPAWPANSNALRCAARTSRPLRPSSAPLTERPCTSVRPAAAQSIVPKRPQSGRESQNHFVRRAQDKAGDPAHVQGVHFHHSLFGRNRPTRVGPPDFSVQPDVALNEGPGAIDRGAE